MAPYPSKRLLAIALVVVSTLLALTLYKLTSLDTCLHLHHAIRRDFFNPWRTTDEKAEISPTVVCAEQNVKAGIALHKMLIDDPLSYKCRRPQQIKNRDEGAWTYCGDPGFALQKPCLVYSFGINYDFTFDDALGKLGCKVLSFDPSMQNISDYQRSENVMFYQTGLGSQDTDDFQPRLNKYVTKPTTWKMRTLKSLMHQSNHTNRTIDLLKIDIESSEWEVMRNILDSGVHKQVKQLLLEWHIFADTPPREDYPKLVKLLQDWKAAGFREFHRHPHPGNLNWDEFNIQSDIAYINLKFKKRRKL